MQLLHTIYYSSQSILCTKYYENTGFNWFLLVTTKTEKKPVLTSLNWFFLVRFRRSLVSNQLRLPVAHFLGKNQTGPDLQTLFKLGTKKKCLLKLQKGAHAGKKTNLKAFTKGSSKAQKDLELVDEQSSEEFDEETSRTSESDRE